MSIGLNISVWHKSKESRFHWYPSCIIMSRMTKYIAIEASNIIFHFLQVLPIVQYKSVIAKQFNGVAAGIV